MSTLTGHYVVLDFLSQVPHGENSNFFDYSLLEEVALFPWLAAAICVYCICVCVQKRDLVSHRTV